MLGEKVSNIQNRCIFVKFKVERLYLVNGRCLLCNGVIVTFIKSEQSVGVLFDEDSSSTNPNTSGKSCSLTSTKHILRKYYIIFSIIFELIFIANRT